MTVALFCFHVSSCLMCVFSVCLRAFVEMSFELHASMCRRNDEMERRRAYDGPAREIENASFSPIVFSCSLLLVNYRMKARQAPQQNYALEPVHCHNYINTLYRQVPSWITIYNYTQPAGSHIYNIYTRTNSQKWQTFITETLLFIYFIIII